MKEEQKSILIAVEKIMSFVKELDDGELEKLITGQKKLTLEEYKSVNEEKVQIRKNTKGRKSSYKKNKNIEELIETNNKNIVQEVNEFDTYVRELSRITSRELAIEYLLDNKLTVTKLKMLAKKLSIYIKSKSKKIDIIEAIVERIVVSRLKIEAFRNS
ncbi:MAG: hypothetical protein ACRC57_14130 [Sarcina sp.]